MQHKLSGEWNPGSLPQLSFSLPKDMGVLYWEFREGGLEVNGVGLLIAVRDGVP